MPSLALPGRRLLRMRIREWTASVEMRQLPNVPGASEAELRQLGALGGVAKVLGGSRIGEWPAEVEEWATLAPDVPSDLLELLETALANGIDALAEAYNACISREHRRKLGTVFTPSLVVEHMLDLAAKSMNEEPKIVIDPGAGVGAFTLAAARRWPSAHVMAIDINPVTLGLLAARLAFEQDRPVGTPLAKVSLRHADFLQELPDLFSAGNPAPILVLGNPPYTRTQALSAEYKRDTALLGMRLTSGHANLAVMFQAATFGHMRMSDTSCMILPATMLFTRAARTLRSSIFRSRRPVTVHRWPAEQRAFIGHNVQAAILLIGNLDNSAPAPAIQVQRTEVRHGHVHPIESWSIDRESREPSSWYGPATNNEQSPASTVLGSFARVRRGLATGANSFFFLTDDARSKLPDCATTPAVPSLRNFSGDAMTLAHHRSWGGPRQRRWLLALDRDQQVTDSIAEYLESNRQSVQDRHLCRQRSVWWAITDLPRPEILLSPLSKERFKIVLNPIGAVPSNNLIGIFVDAAKAETLANWLKSPEGQSRLRLVSRRYHGGSHKIEPGDLRRLWVPDDVAQPYAEVQELQLKWPSLDAHGADTVR